MADVKALLDELLNSAGPPAGPLSAVDLLLVQSESGLLAEKKLVTADILASYDSQRLISFGFSEGVAALLKKAFPGTGVHAVTLEKVEELIAQQATHQQATDQRFAALALSLQRPGASMTSTTDAEVYQQMPRKKLKLSSVHAEGLLPDELGRLHPGRENEYMRPAFISVLEQVEGAGPASTMLLKNAKDPTSLVTIKDVHFVNTYKSYCIDGKYAPDFTVVFAGNNPTSFSALGFVELMRHPLDDAHRGRMYKYLVATMVANPQRPFARGLLTSMVDVEIFHIARQRPGSNQFIYSESGGINMSTEDGKRKGWQLIQAFCRGDLGGSWGWEVPQLQFIAVNDGMALDVVGVLGCSRGVLVWRVAIQGDEYVCKQYLDDLRRPVFEAEKAAMEHISGCKDVWSVFPTLVAHNNEKMLLLMQPVVAPADEITEAALDSLVSSISWLHESGWVNRDLEPKHLGLSHNALCWIDWNTSMQLGDTSKGYSGTMVYTSDDVLSAIRYSDDDQNQPVAARMQQDYVPLVKTVYALIHRGAAQAIDQLVLRIHPMSLCLKAQEVASFWRAELSESTASGRAWRELVQLAHVDDASPPTKEQLAAAVKKIKEGLACMLRARGL